MTTRSFRSLVLTAACALTLGLVAGAAHAQDGGDPNRNNRPFFARGALGIGYVGFEDDQDQSSLTIDHVGMYWDLAVGGKVWKELALHASYFGGWAWEPDVKVGGKSLGGQHGSEQSLAVLGVGPGVTYHFLPVNVYLSYAVGLGVSVLQFHENAGTGESPGWSSLGFANQVVVGKEWWIGNGMAIGGAVQAMYARLEDDGVNYHSFGGSVLLSATYH